MLCYRTFRTAISTWPRLQAPSRRIERNTSAHCAKIYACTSNQTTNSTSCPIHLRKARLGDVQKLAKIEVATEGYYGTEQDLAVVELAVHPQYRRRGIASALMTEALAIGTRKIARKAGRGSAILEVNVSNTAAIALYTGLGFRVQQQRKKYYPDGSDADVMCLPL